MFDRLKKVFGKADSSGADAEKGKNPHDTRVAACALLLEMANVDGEFSDEEQGGIVSMLKNDFELSPEDADELMEASRKELDGSIDLWQFTSMINQNYSKEEKLNIIEMVWKVVYADGVLDKHEDYLIHKLANLLRLSHKDLINAKLKVLGKS